MDTTSSALADLNNLAASAAAEEVAGAASPIGVSNRVQFGLNAPDNGTERALQYSAVERAKIEKAIMREVRRLKFRLYFQLFGLYFSKFMLESRVLRLRALGYVSGNLAKRGFSRHR